MEVGRIAFAPSQGPWTLQDDSTFSTLGDKRVIAANRISPAIVFGGLGAETDSNALLIAAAPELLAALRAHDAYMLAGYSGPDSDALHPKAAENWRRVRAAIAKAEGR